MKLNFLLISRRQMLGVLLTLWASWPAVAAANPVILDDSLSSQQTVFMKQDWADHFPNHPVMIKPTSLHAVLARATVDVRLRVDAYSGKNAKIYLVIPQIGNSGPLPGDMLIAWRTRGIMSSGAATPSTRTLVYTGRIAASVLGDRFDFSITGDSRSIGNNLQFNPYFEIELN